MNMNLFYVAFLRRHHSNDSNEKMNVKSSDGCRKQKDAFLIVCVLLIIISQF